MVFRRGEDDNGVAAAEVDADAWTARWTGDVRDEDRGSFFLTTVGDSTNMIDGPPVSSGSIFVRGVGLEVNFGRDWLRMVGGRTRLVAEDDV